MTTTQALQAAGDLDLHAHDQENCMLAIVPQDNPANSVRKIRVFVAESNTMAGQLMEGGLKRCRAGFQIQALATDSRSALRQLRESGPDVAIISADLPDGPLMGFKLLYELKDSPPRCSIIMLLRSIDRELVIDALRGGARGIFLRTDPINALAKCISVVHDGQVWINNQALEFLLEIITHLKPFRMAEPDTFTCLTSREREITSLVGEGMKNEEIAQQLLISEHTVRNYLSRVFEKLGLSSRVELALLAQQMKAI